MKNLYQLLILLSLICLTTFTSKGQVLNENFNSGLPTTWIQKPVSTWSLNSGLGSSVNAFAYTYKENSDADTTSIESPTLNLSSVSNLTVSFKMASVAKYFVGPDLTLYYDAGAGRQFVARWGTSFNSNTTYTITYGADYQEPLDSQYVEWIACTHTISSINSSAVKFIFEAELVNGGYALIDDVVIVGATPTVTTAINLYSNEQEVVVSPNPVLNKKIHITGKEIKTIFLFDNSGREVPITYINNKSDVELDITACRSGVYFLYILTDKGSSISKKILVE